MVIAFIGGSGSGKDTQARLLSEKLDIPTISAGAMLREAYEAGNPLGIEASTYWKKGEWVPDEITSEIILNYINSHHIKEFIITGYPRFAEQAYTFDRILEVVGLKLTAVVHLSVEKSELWERLQTQKIEDPARKDTSEEAMGKRLDSYYETIEPLLKKYAKDDILVNVDGTPSVTTVAAMIDEGLEKVPAFAVEISIKREQKSIEN